MTNSQREAARWLAAIVDATKLNIKAIVNAAIKRGKGDAFVQAADAVRMSLQCHVNYSDGIVADEPSEKCSCEACTAAREYDRVRGER